MGELRPHSLRPRTSCSVQPDEGQSCYFSLSEAFLFKSSLALGLTNFILGTLMELKTHTVSSTLYFKVSTTKLRELYRILLLKVLLCRSGSGFLILASCSLKTTGIFFSVQAAMKLSGSNCPFERNSSSFPWSIKMSIWNPNGPSRDRSHHMPSTYFHWVPNIPKDRAQGCELEQMLTQTCIFQKFSKHKLELMASHGVIKNRHPLWFHWEIGISELWKLFCYVRVHSVVSFPRIFGGIHVKANRGAEVPGVISLILQPRGCVLRQLAKLWYEILFCASKTRQPVKCRPLSPLSLGW